jgi:ERCC4-type nuclease
VGVPPLFTKSINKNFFTKNDLPEDLSIFVDTREQQPLSFNTSESMKLDFGDYTTGGDYYSYTYVDRKSEGDFKTTLSKGNLERFREELKRARDFDSYLFIAVESDIEKIQKNNNFKPHKVNIKYIFHNMRVLQHEFSDNCQFIFTGNRDNSENIIPKLLFYGKKLWKVDLQYYIDKYGIDG